MSQITNKNSSIHPAQYGVYGAPIIKCAIYPLIMNNN